MSLRTLNRSSEYFRRFPFLFQTYLYILEGLPTSRTEHVSRFLTRLAIVSSDTSVTAVVYVSEKKQQMKL